MSLPIKTTAEDVEAIVGYLRTKATGASIADAKAALGKTLLDGRKLSAYETWGFLTKDTGRLRLTEVGRELSRASDERKRAIFSEVVRSIGPYRMAVEWLFHQRLDKVTNIEVAAHWHDHSPNKLGTGNEGTIRDQALCFFSLAAAAGFGTYVMGRSGHPTRLEVSLEALGQFIGETGLEDDSPPTEQSDSNTEVDPQDHKDEPTPVNMADRFSRSSNLQEKPRIFISHSKNMEIVDQVKTMLEYADLEFEIAEDEETTAIPVPDKVLAAMRRCTSAVICITADDQR